MAKTIPAVGEAFLGDNPYAMKVMKFKCGLASASPDVTLTADTLEVLVKLVSIPAGTLVHEVSWFVEEAFTASNTITIGDTDSAAGYAAAADIACTLKDTAITSWRSLMGTLGSGAGTVGYHGGRLYGVSNGMDINLVTVQDTAMAVGILDVFIVYSGAAAGVAQTS
jgi:hypothetical protein